MPQIILKNIRAVLFPRIYLTGQPIKKQVPVGQGIIDWKEFFATAKTAGVKNFFVETDLDKFKDSAAYIKGL